jgi:hypothetical protein
MQRIPITELDATRKVLRDNNISFRIYFRGPRKHAYAMNTNKKDATAFVVYKHTKQATNLF